MNLGERRANLGLGIFVRKTVLSGNIFWTGFKSRHLIFEKNQEKLLFSKD